MAAGAKFTWHFGPFAAINTNLNIYFTYLYCKIKCSICPLYSCNPVAYMKVESPQKCMKKLLLFNNIL